MLLGLNKCISLVLLSSPTGLPHLPSLCKRSRLRTSSSAHFFPPIPVWPTAVAAASPPFKAEHGELRNRLYGPHPVSLPASSPPASPQEPYFSVLGWPTEMEWTKTWAKVRKSVLTDTKHEVSCSTGHSANASWARSECQPGIRQGGKVRDEIGFLPCLWLFSFCTALTV